MSRIVLGIALLALSPLNTLAAQSSAGRPSRIGACDPRIDVCALPPGGGALHYIDTSGSFIQSCNILVGPGQTGIAVGPNAGSVELDGNGFSIIGDPSLTSVGGIVFESSPAEREKFQLTNGNLPDITDAISISNVGTVNVIGGAVWLCGGRGLHVTDCGSVQVEGMSFSQCATGIDASSVSSLQVSGCVMIDNGTAVSVCANSSRFTDVVVQRGSNGIVSDDSCLNPATPEPTLLSCSDTLIEYVLLCGLSVNTVRPFSDILSLEDVDIRRSGQHGISINVAGSLDFSVSNSSSSDNGGDGLNTNVVQKVELVFKTVRLDFNAGNGGTVSGGSVELQGSDSSFSHNGVRGLQVSGGGGGPGGGGGGSVMLKSLVLMGNAIDACDIDFSSSPTSGKASISDTHFTSNVGKGLALHNVSATLQSTECSSNGSHGLQGQLSDIKCDLVKCNSNGGNGFDITESSASLTSCVALQNSGDGISAINSGTVRPYEMDIRFMCLSSNGGLGLRAVGNCHPRVDDSRIMGNTSGGLSISSGSGLQVQIHVQRCSLDSNGAIACDIQNARGGVVEQCVVSNSPTGILVGDSSGGGHCTGVRVSDNTVASCNTGIQVLPGGSHLVVRNSVASSLAAYSVGVGNLFGPIVTSANMASNTNPSCNYAP